MRALVVTAALLGLFVAVTSDVLANPPDSSVTFSILRNGSELGRHTVRYRNDGDRLVVENRIRISVRLAIFEAYRYEMDSDEQWRGTEMIGLHSRTDKNGDPYEVMARRTRDGFSVHRRDGRTTAPADSVVDSPSYNVLAGHPTHMIDAEAGRIWNVRVAGPAAETLTIGRQRLETSRFRVTGDLDAILWYAADGRMVKKRLIAPDDSTVITQRR